MQPAHAHEPTLLTAAESTRPSLRRCAVASGYNLNEAEVVCKIMVTAALNLSPTELIRAILAKISTVDCHTLDTVQGNSYSTSKRAGIRKNRLFSVELKAASQRNG